MQLSRQYLFKESFAYFSKIILNQILNMTMGLFGKIKGAELSCLQSWTVLPAVQTRRTLLASHEMKNTTIKALECWAAEMMY